MLHRACSTTLSYQTDFLFVQAQGTEWAVIELIKYTEAGVLSEAARNPSGMQSIS